MEDKKVFLRNFLEFGPGVSTRDAMRRYSDEDFNREMQKDLNMSDIAMGRGDVPKKDIDDYEKRRQKEYDDYNNPKEYDPLAPPVDLARREEALRLALVQKGLTAPQQLKGTDFILDKKKQLEKFKFYKPNFPFLRGTYI